MCQQTAQLLIDIVLNLLLAFAGVVLALWYENLGSPRLKILPGITTDDVKSNGWRVRFIHLNVKNVPKRVPFVPRQTAYSCHGTITFFTPDSKQVGKTMSIRWDGAPEPIKAEVVDNKIVHLPDSRLIRLSRYIDIPPGETESLAAAVRIHDESHAFGWTSKSYFHNWQHPDYSLPTGRYIARVKIVSGDRMFQKDFPFVNPGEFERFDLGIQA